MRRRRAPRPASPDLVVVRISIYVRPGASAKAVGGTHDQALAVRVVEAAQKGAATDAAMKALADALGLPERSLTLVHGAASRHKLIAVTVPRDRVDGLNERVQALRSRAPV